MLVELEGVEKYYNRNLANEVRALTTIDLQIAEGEVVCLQGPSGSGKSTLLSIIGCIFPPTSGRARIAGKQLARLPDYFLTQHRRNTIGFIFQRFNLIDALTVKENITLPLLPLGVVPAEQNNMVQKLLDKFGITHRQNFHVNRISGGEMQRVAIARALILQPAIVLADEPTAHLDRELSLQFMEVMKVLKEEGKTIILTSHDPTIAEDPIIDTRITMADGKIVRRERLNAH